MVLDQSVKENIIERSQTYEQLQETIKVDHSNARIGKEAIEEVKGLTESKINEVENEEDEDAIYFDNPHFSNEGVEVREPEL